MRLMTLPKTFSSVFLPMIATALMYFFAGKLTLALLVPPSYATVIWPPAGIAIGAALMWGYRVLPGVFIAELVINSHGFSGLLASPSELTAFIFTPFTRMIHLWLAIMLIRSYADYPNPLISSRKILVFFLLAGPIASFFPTLLRIYALNLTGFIDEHDLLFLLLSGWLSDCLGVVIFTPLFFCVFDQQRNIWQHRRLVLGLPVCLLFALTAITTRMGLDHEAERLNLIINKQSHSIKEALHKGFQQHLATLGQFKNLSNLPATITAANFNLFSQIIFNQQADVSHLEWFVAHKQPTGYTFTSQFRAARLNKSGNGANDLAKTLDTLNFANGLVAITGSQDLFVLMPFIASEENSCLCLTGVMTATINLKSFIETALDTTVLDHLVVRIMADHPGAPATSIYHSNNHDKHADPLGLSHQEAIILANQAWHLELAPDDKFLDSYYSPAVWQLLIGCLALIGLTTLGLLILSGQKASLKAQIAKRTDALKLNNKQLAASEKQFRKLVQSQAAIVWRADPLTLRFIFVSNEAEALLGYPTALWLSDADFCKHHIHEDDLDSLSAFRATHISKHLNNQIEFRMIAADGRYVWLRNFIEVTKKNGQVTELFGFMIDITQHKQAEEQMRLAATTFESQQGIMITDKNSNILRVNNAFTEITGYTQEQVLGKNPRLLSSGRHDASFYQKLWQQLLKNGRYEGEIWNRRRNGEIYPEWLTITAVKTFSGDTSYYVCVFADITKKKDAEGKIHALAFYDPLTKLPNRRLLLDRFEQELSNAKRHKQFGAVIFLDLDHFKLLNDAQGHLVGDELLMQVASRLVSVLRKEDTPARLGGDEFVVLLHANTDNLSLVADQAGIVAEKIRDCLNRPFFLNHYQHQLSTSIGIALFPEHHDSPEIILQQADTAMYRAKASGRNAISFFHPSMQEAAELRLSLEHEIKQAIDAGRFLLCYQPQVDSDGKVLSAEALIRWKSAGKGVLLPIDFIPIAEESNLILGIGRWVLLEACNQIKAWQTQGIAIPPIAVNVSSRQFRQLDFVHQVKQALDTSGINPELLGIELTENVLIIDIDDTIVKLTALKELGITIAVDKFGTGYSSLMYLQRLPIDIIKIDRKFVKDMITNTNNAVIVEATLGMAQHLNIRVIAEGVETAEQMAFLQERNCNIFQGFYFSQPLAAADYKDLYLS